MHSRRIVSESDRLREDSFSTFLREFLNDSVGQLQFDRLVAQILSNYVSIDCFLPSVLVVVLSVSCPFPAVSSIGCK